MKRLKDILDHFGWDRVQRGELPPEITTEEDNFVRGVHQYDLYALNGVCVITEDKRQIVELSGVAKTSDGYVRKAQIRQNRVVRVQNPDEFLDGFKHLHGFRNCFIFVESEGMRFDDIGKRMEEAGELYHSS